MMECAAKIFFRFIKEDAGFIYFLSFTIFIKAEFRDSELSAFASDVVVIPHIGGKFFSSFGDASFIIFAVVIRAIAAASVVGKFFIDALATVTEDAIPI